MHTSSTTARLAALALTLATLAAPAAAAITSYQGRFDGDDDRFVIDFDLAAATRLSATTWSYAGGTNAAGDAVAAGGFVPVLALFEATEGLLRIVRGSTHTCAQGGSADPATGFCWDAMFDGLFAAGHYRLVLTQDGNEPLGTFFDDGFAQDGVPDYTGQLFAGQPGLHFVQVDGAQRDAHWALDISIGSVPEPASPALLVLAGAAWALARRTARSTRPSA
ncbi:PEP-CTERM sorting domain-containing protein [Aquincola sp. S2]|uniref:PEP-CTERM sorting domain-containing protein n=1 Tax=Pseudaquabacterium terrae TaxID=2732868 RepID=A0ABX2EA26_9BURK|nr:DVUA0089 family protein [Aquabacterium terrae]NRF65386.1 PEP-CTERM sorting domain-containing protein [Aquabacterium terrae]